jgi:hypothetical protein
VFEEPTKSSSSGLSIAWIIGAVFVLAAGGFAYWYYEQESNRAREQPELSEAAREYLEFLALTDVAMGAEDTFLEQTLVTIEGKITNLGERTVAQVRIYCVFREVNGIEIDRQLMTIVGRRGDPLEPGETQSFRLPFDQIPPQWNQAMPNLFVAEIEFEG